MNSKLDPDQFETFLKEHPEWVWKGQHIEREWRFPDFKESLVFVNRIAVVAEELDHHPDIEIRYDRVVLKLTTHSEGGVTGSDLGLAARIESIQ